ncbi:MAG: hypothetical protein EP330_24370 [Deltaproteobacteria bacterium]|nr:MAG: hypothetical protein EP330_24370 [Deltaproteobacteria bacterium]
MARILALPASVFGIWLLTWQLWLGGLWWLGLAALLWRRWWPGARLGLAWTGSGLVLVPWCVLGYIDRVEVLTARYLAGGPEALGMLDLVAVWGLNLVMAAVGLVVGLPEVAIETSLLAVPRGPALEWHSDRFPRCAPKVAAVVADHQRAARGGAHSFREQRVAWRYGEAGSSVRAALALNPVTVRSERDGDVLHVRATVPVDYPAHAPLVLGRFAGRTLVVEEGLFHALEARGWLMPYTLTYTAEVPIDSGPPPMCEAWGIRVARVAGVAPF